MIAAEMSIKYTMLLSCLKSISTGIHPGYRPSTILLHAEYSVRGPEVKTRNTQERVISTSAVDVYIGSGESYIQEYS